MIKTQLVDKRNYAVLLPQIIREISAAPVTGLDIETHDDNRHEGLNKFCGYDPVTRKKPAGKKLIFDMQRTVITGFSVYPEGSEFAYYINLAHADVDNRLEWEVAKYILQARPTNAHWVCHNAPFELTAFYTALGVELDNVIDSMQLCVSCYGPDEYSWEKFKRAGLGEIGKFIPLLRRAAVDYDASVDRQFKGELADIAGKITAKESDAAHCYNGWVNEIAWGYSLKKAVHQHFGVQMTTFQEVLGDKAHMGQLTGDEVAAYGADDAYWAVRLFRHVMTMMVGHAPNAIRTFFEQENPMIHIFSDIWCHGMKLDLEKVLERRDHERVVFAQHLRELKTALREAKWRDEPDARLVKWEKWYREKDGWKRYRAKIDDWLKQADSADAYQQCQQVRSPVSNAWAEDCGDTESVGVNLVHYMPMRTILYDLLQLPLEFSNGKVQSDGDSRGNLRFKAEKAVDDGETVEGWKAVAPVAIKVLDCLTAMASCEQRMKLYLTPYIHLIDPKTGHIYPVVSSMLATRRMGSRDPNPMQLAKRGESTYIRGFFEADYDDHVVVSRDWSAIELVIIGELSKDPEFAKVYGQLPHGDLHTGAAADILGVEVKGLDDVAFKGLKRATDWANWGELYGDRVDLSTIGRLQRNFRAEEMTPAESFKYFRGTPVGKGANFNYWYSGWLGTIGDNMGWDADTTAEAVRRYVDRFIVAETWRRSVIEQGCRQGFIELPDGHRRYRLEATQEWLAHWLLKWPIDDEDPVTGLGGAVREIARRIQSRAKNQLVNTMVQGTCATIAKRSMLRINQRMKDQGWTRREARVLMPIHDELVYTVHRDLVHDFLDLSQEIMQSHKDIFPTLALDSSPAIGLTFEPWHADKAPFGQIELYEPPKLVVGEKLADTRLNKDGVALVLDYLFQRQHA